MTAWLWPWCAFLFLVPFEDLLNVANLGTPFHLLGLAAALLLALARPGRITRAAALCVVFLVATLALSYFGSVDPAATRSALAPIGLAWLTYVLATASGLDRSHFVTAARAWLWGGCAVSLCAIGAFLAGRTDVDGRLAPVLGPFEGDPNYFVAGLVFPFAIGVVFSLTRVRRLEGLVALGPMIVAAGLAQSRGGLLALAVTLGVALVASRRWKTLLAVCAFVPVVMFSFQPSVGRLDFQLATGSRRTEIWPVGLQEGARRMATGTGLATFPRLTASASGLYWPRDPHNTYLQAFTEAGLPGLLGLGLVFGVHLAMRRRSPLAAPVLAGLAGTAVAGVFLHLLSFSLLWVAWIVAAQTAQAPDPVLAPVRTS